MRLAPTSYIFTAFALAAAFSPAKGAGESPSAAAPTVRETQRPRAGANPFGITVGVTTCRWAGLLLDGTPTVTPSSEKQLETVVVKARDPGRFYPKATEIEANCDEVDGVVHTLYVGVEDEADNAGARDAYGVLASKYRKAEGGPIPSKGPGYARFSAAGTAVELQAWGSRKDFLVVYTEGKLFERLRKFKEERRKGL